MDVVLVHGTTQSPASWEPLGEELTRHGHRPHLIDLDLPIRRHSEGGADLDGYLDAAAAQVPGSVREPVVVAHSGAGAVLADLAQRLGAGRQVWVAAWVPDPITRAPMLDELLAHGPVIMNPEWRERTGALDDADATYFLFHDCAHRSLRRALHTVRLWSPPEVYRARPQADPTAVPSTYVVPALDRTLRPEWMATAARHRLGIEPISVHTGHCPHTSEPRLLARIIDSTRSTTAQPRGRRPLTPLGKTDPGKADGSARPPVPSGEVGGTCCLTRATHTRVIPGDAGSVDVWQRGRRWRQRGTFWERDS